MKKKIILIIYIGFTFGFMLGVVLTSVIATLVIADGKLHPYTNAFSDFIGNPLWALLIHSSVCGLLGAIIFVSALIYDIDEWGLLRATLVHFFVIIVSFYSAAFFMRWFSPFDLSAVGTSLMMFIVIYTGIWLGQFLSCKSQVDEINRNLSIKKNSIRGSENAGL